jgi:hypothetical protein
VTPSEPADARGGGAGWWSKLLSLGVSVSILLILGYWCSAHRADFSRTLGRMKIGYFVTAVTMIPVYMAVRGIRLDVLLGKSGRSVGLLRAMAITFIGTSLNVLLPSNLGDVAKAYYAYRYNLPKEVALSVVIFDKAFGMTAAMLVGMAAAASQGLWPAVGLAGLVGTALIFIIFLPRLVPWRLLGWALKKTMGKTLARDRALEASRLPLGLKLTAIVLSLAACGLVYVQYYLLCRALGLNVSLIFALVVSPLMDLAKAVPLTANGLGTREAVAVFMLGRTGIQAGDAMLSSLIYTAVSLWIPALIGAPFVWLAVHARPQGTGS